MTLIRPGLARLSPFSRPRVKQSGRADVTALSPLSAVAAFPAGGAEALPDTASSGRAAAFVNIAPALVTMVVGLAVLFCVGFLQTPAVHNGVHDTRHATGFPCH
jgi:cobalt transporter subunit CbtB